MQSFFQPDWDLERLHRIESALRIQHAALGNRSILLGDETEIMRTGNAQPSLQLADPELHDVIVGLHPFGEEALGFGGCDQFGERPEADAAGESRHSWPAQFDKPKSRWVPRVTVGKERIFKGAVCRYEFVRDRIIDAGGCTQTYHIPRAFLDVDVVFRE